jgi:hypothetical protein
VLAGSVGTTVALKNGQIGAVQDQIHTRETTAHGAHEIGPWTPHTFWPVAGSEEDAVFLLWASPEGPFPPMMDNAFFMTLLRHMSDVSEKKTSMDVLQVMLNQ